MQHNSDIFIERLKTLKDEVQKCQTQHQLNSCMNCSQVLGCELRENYVKSVYESMSKGETGGFEF